jgi:DNA replication protein DnaC
MSKRKINTREAFRRMNLPELHVNSRLETIPDKCRHKQIMLDLTADIKNVVESGENFLLWGDFGVGKSGCAAILLKAALSKGIIGFWTTYEDYINSVMSDIYYDEDTSFDDKCRRSPILVMDELIVRENSKQKETMIEVLIRHRLEKKRSTIITTNHSPSWLKEHHRSFFSLFNGHYSILEVKGHNFRIK